MSGACLFFAHLRARPARGSPQAHGVTGPRRRAPPALQDTGRLASCLSTRTVRRYFTVPRTRYNNQYFNSSRGPGLCPTLCTRPIFQQCSPPRALSARALLLPSKPQPVPASLPTLFPTGGARSSPAGAPSLPSPSFPSPPHPSRSSGARCSQPRRRAACCPGAPPLPDKTGRQVHAQAGSAK